MSKMDRISRDVGLSNDDWAVKIEARVDEEGQFYAIGKIPEMQIAYYYPLHVKNG